MRQSITLCLGTALTSAAPGAEHYLSSVAQLTRVSVKARSIGWTASRADCEDHQHCPVNLLRQPPSTNISATSY